MGIIIEICPREGLAIACLDNGESIIGSEHESDFADCVKSGDCEPACAYIRDNLKPEFRIVARDSVTNEYVNRLATDKEKEQTCKAIYFESETDFSNTEMAEIYLIWQAASELENEAE